MSAAGEVHGQVHGDDARRARRAETRALFAPELLPTLRRATLELSWLLDRGYAPRAARTLVGDRYGLLERQRLAILRSACGDRARADRLARRRSLPGLAGARLAIDGFNCLVTLEEAVSGGVLLRGRDGALRDLAGVHGGFVPGADTERALGLLGEALAAVGPAEVRFVFDRPVSRSGATARLVEAHGALRGWPWRAELAASADGALAASAGWVVASSDGPLIDRCEAWVCLPGAIAVDELPAAFVVDLSEAASADAPAAG